MRQITCKIRIKNTSCATIVTTKPIGKHMIKRLIKHGNSRAIVVDKALLEAAGIAEDALFQVSINPNGGLVIQSIENNKKDVVKESFEKLNKKYKNLMQRLADL